VDDEQDGQWLATPAGAGEVVLEISIGEDVELSDEARRAIETLISEFAEDEVTGHAWNTCPAKAVQDCQPYDCTLGRCKPETNRRCLADWRCKIAPPKGGCSRVGQPVGCDRARC
jgi:hypothetical protein